MKTLRDKFENCKPDSVFPVCNWGGLEVFYDTSNGETLVTTWNFGDGRSRFSHNRIHYTKNGRAYIRRNYSRYYLDEMLKVQ